MSFEDAAEYTEFTSISPETEQDIGKLTQRLFSLAEKNSTPDVRLDQTGNQLTVGRASWSNPSSELVISRLGETTRYAMHRTMPTQDGREDRLVTSILHIGMGVFEASAVERSVEKTLMGPSIDGERPVSLKGEPCDNLISDLKAAEEFILTRQQRSSLMGRLRHLLPGIMGNIIGTRSHR